jgi:hypothetical protein
MAGLVAPQRGRPIVWRRAEPDSDEVDCRGGLHLVHDHAFAASGDAVNALADFARFCADAGLPTDRGIGVHLSAGDLRTPEASCVNVHADGCEIVVADAAGVRRALVWIEEEMLRRGGTFLPIGGTERAPALRTRLLLEYQALAKDCAEGLPDAYLNRIAHCGVNALLLPVGRVAGSPVTTLLDPLPDAFVDALRTRIERYARYGIRLFIYAIEPHPRRERNGSMFSCTSSPGRRAELEAGMRRLFAEAPGLGGIVVICVGERPSHCFSMAPPNHLMRNRCPQCGERDANEVLAEVLETIERGVHSAAPDAEFIAWPYTQSAVWGEHATIDFAPHTPERVCLIHNFEQGGRPEQLGKVRRTDDYWLSYPGPSALFTACAEGAHNAGRDLYAKVAVSCGHEIASVPYIPVPGLLYRKFRGVRAAGCQGVFMNWESGNAPSLMLRAAGELNFGPFPESEEAFLLALAERDWGEHAAKVVRAWQAFADAYEHFPATIGFSYFGPMHNGAAWPLYLQPADLPLPRNWMPDRFSGDRIGDCLGYHSIDEAITLCRRMLERWQRGTHILAPLRERFAGDPARALDIAIALALACHFESGVNILTFYGLREKLATARDEQARELLRRMHALVVDEKDVSGRLADLCDAFPDLGYCPEAGEHKYSAAKLRWRIGTLDRLLAEAFPRVAARLAAGESAFAAGADIAPQGPVLVGRRLAGDAADAATWTNIADTGDFAAPSSRSTSCAAAWDDDTLYLRFACAEPDMAALYCETEDKTVIVDDDHVWVTAEASQFEDGMKFKVNARGAREFVPFRPMGVRPVTPGWALPRSPQPESSYRWRADVQHGAAAWYAVLRLPICFLEERGLSGRALRLNLGRRTRRGATVEQAIWASPLPPRDGRSSPAPYGRLVLED